MLTKENLCDAKARSVRPGDLPNSDSGLLSPARFPVGHEYSVECNYSNSLEVILLCKVICLLAGAA